MEKFFTQQAFRLRRFRIGHGGGNKNNKKTKPSWVVPVSHGYHVVKDQSFNGESEEEELDSDFLVVQREQIEELELWLFGLFDPWIGDGVNKYMQSHLLQNKPKEMNIRKKSKETLRKAYVGARSRMREDGRGSAASVMVIDGERLVMAHMGDYRIAVCKNGVAHQINRNHYHQPTGRHWTRKLFSVRMLACDAGNTEGLREARSSGIVVGTERVGSDTEFIIVASTGVWEVMRSQEAVSLIRHIEDPQQAADCLAKEAMTRMSKSNISCLVIRFD